LIAANGSAAHPALTRIAHVSNVAELAEAIAERIAAAQDQIRSLEAARAALVPAPARRSSIGTRRPRRFASSADSAARAAELPVPAADNASAASTPRPARRRTKPSEPGQTAQSRPQRGSRRRELASGQLEELLAASTGGLSIIALAARTKVPESRVRERLLELQRAGQVHSGGSRRTSLWQLITDEERIAQRAAELEQASTR